MTNQEKFHLFDAINDIPQLRGAGLAYVGDGQCEILRDTQHISGFDTWIVLVATETGSDVKQDLPRAARVEPSIAKELLGVGINCTGAVLAGFATAAEATAAPLTAGASGVLAYITGAGAAATALQCGLSVGRVVDYFTDPDSITMLDSEAWYNSANDVLDVVALLGAAAAVGQAAQGVLRLEKSSGKPIKEILKGMSRAERKRLARELAEYAGTKSNKQFKALVRAGELASIYSQKSVDMALKKVLLDSISSALSIAGSGTSGVLNEAYTVYIVQEQ